MTEQDNSGDTRGTAPTVQGEPTPVSRAARPQEADPLVGSVLAGRYRIVSRLGKGGMGLVYEARNEALGKRVAVKVMRPDLADVDQAMQRFEREAKSAAAIAHEHIVDVIDYGHTEDGTAFMVMELLEGTTLERLLEQSGPLEVGRAMAIARQIARGLSAAHENGVVHRDLKSANVFLLERDGHDHVKILDFGISKLRRLEDEELRLTSTGAVMGTPNYMSPEQARGETDIDHRVDIYALGVLTYEMLTGQVPLIGRNFLEVTYKHLNEEPVPPSERRPDLGIPRDVDLVVLKCLAKSPADRYQTTGELIDALPRPSALPGGWSSDSVTSVATARKKPRERSWVGIGLPGALGVLAVVIGLFYLFRTGGEGPGQREGSGTADGASTLVEDAPSLRSTTDAAHGDAGAVVARSADGSREAATERPTPSDASPAPVRLTVVPTPPTATVLRGGVEIGSGPTEVLAARGTSVELTVLARGYAPARLQLTASGDRTIPVLLKRTGSREPAPGSSPDAGQRPPASQGDLRPDPYGQKAP